MTVVASPAEAKEHKHVILQHGSHLLVDLTVIGGCATRPATQAICGSGTNNTRERSSKPGDLPACNAGGGVAA